MLCVTRSFVLGCHEPRSNPSTRLNCRAFLAVRRGNWSPNRLQYFSLQLGHLSFNIGNPIRARDADPSTCSPEVSVFYASRIAALLQHHLEDELETCYHADMADFHGIVAGVLGLLPICRGEWKFPTASEQAMSHSAPPRLCD